MGHRWPPEMDSLAEEVPLTEDQGLSPDDVLERMGSRSPMLGLIVVITGFSWAATSMTGMNAAFVTQSCDNNCSEMISVVDEFDLRGELTYQADMTTTTFMLGQMIGGTYLSQLGDKYGRRPVMLLSFSMMFVTGCLAALSPNIIVFCAVRFIQGAFYTAGALVAWVLGYECSPVEMRFFTSTLFGMMWVVGYCMLTPVAYFSPSWRWVTFVCGIPHLLLFIACYFFTPESLHYLVSIDNRKKVQQWLDKANGAKNKKLLGISPDSIVNAKKSQESAGHLFHQVWRHKTFLFYISIFVYIWICDTFIYFGLSLYSTHLAGNVYLNYLFMGLVEIPAYILSPLGMNKIGRRFVVSWSHLLAAGAFVGLLFAPAGSITLLLWLIGKLCISCSFMGIYVYASEIFPTDSRNLCLGFCEMMSRIGGILASQIGILNSLHPSLPMIILAFISFFGGLFALYLPETRGKQLPSTIEESSRRQF